ncbi:MAG: cupredoxin domain-containing protein [Acidimicrobiales bacterium]
MKRFVAVAGILALGWTLAACGSSGTTKASAGSGGPSVTLTAANISYSPTDIQVHSGSVTFVVKNTDGVEHNLTIDGTGVNKDVAKGTTVSTTATLKAGTYAFHCEYHPTQMKGTITVS